MAEVSARATVEGRKEEGGAGCQETVAATGAKVAVAVAAPAALEGKTWVCARKCRRFRNYRGFRRIGTRHCTRNGPAVPDLSRKREAPPPRPSAQAAAGIRARESPPSKCHRPCHGTRADPAAFPPAPPSPPPLPPPPKPPGPPPAPPAPPSPPPLPPPPKPPGGGLPAVSAVRRSGGGGRGASRPRTRPPRPPFSGLLPQSQLICQVSPRPPAGRDGREGALLPSRRVHGSTSKVARDEGVDHATAIRSGHASAERGGDEVVDLRF